MSAPTTRRPSRPTGGSAMPSTSDSKSGSLIDSAHHGPISQRRSGASSPAGRTTPNDDNFGPDRPGPRRHRPRPRRRGRPTNRVGGARDAGPPPDPGAVREGASARGPPDRGLPSRHDRDGEPHANPGRDRKSVV